MTTTFAFVAVLSFVEKGAQHYRCSCTPSHLCSLHSVWVSALTFVVVSTSVLAFVIRTHIRGCGCPHHIDKDNMMRRDTPSPCRKGDDTMRRVIVSPNGPSTLSFAFAFLGFERRRGRGRGSWPRAIPGVVVVASQWASVVVCGERAKPSKTSKNACFLVRTQTIDLKYYI